MAREVEGSLTVLPDSTPVAPPGVQDAYRWRVMYDGGETVGEFDRPDGLGFGEVDRARIRGMILEPVDEGARPAHILIVPDGAQAVFFRRRAILGVTEGEQTLVGLAHCIGWRRPGTGEEVYHFVLEDGRSLLTSDLQAI